MEIDPGPLPINPPTAVTTLKQARLYINACAAWRDLGKDKEPEPGEAFSFVEGSSVETKEDIIEQFGPALTEEVSCSWALYGWPAESEILWEKGLATWAGYPEKLRNRIANLIEQLKNRQKAVEDYNNMTTNK